MRTGRGVRRSVTWSVMAFLAAGVVTGCSREITDATPVADPEVEHIKAEDLGPRIAQWQNRRLEGSPVSVINATCQDGLIIVPGNSALCRFVLNDAVMYDTRVRVIVRESDHQIDFAVDMLGPTDRGE